MRANNIGAAREREPVGAPVIIERVGEEASIYRINGLNPIEREISMERVYHMPRPVYFLNTLIGQNAHIREYIRKSGDPETGLAYIKTFRLKPGQVLRLIDMSQVATRSWVASMMTEDEIRSLNESFPLGEGIVRRVSGGMEEEDDLIVAKAICSILERYPVADGYYSAPQPRGFHAEIGLCPSAFNKFVHIHTNVKRDEGPRRAGKKTRRNANAGSALSFNFGLASTPEPKRGAFAFNSTPVRKSLFGSSRRTRRMRTRRRRT